MNHMKMTFFCRLMLTFQIVNIFFDLEKKTTKKILNLILK
jgi:hypothetical protein